MQSLSLVRCLRSNCLQFAASKTSSSRSNIFHHYYVSFRVMASSPLHPDYKVRQIVIDKNLKLWSLTSIRSLNNLESSENSRRKKLMILFAYMLPNEKHLDKYRKIYYDHGFDVLTVQTSPFQFFFPKIGAQKVADHVYEFVEKQGCANGASNHYPDVMVHAFSVGGYQFAEFLHRLYAATGDSGSGGGGGQWIRDAIKGTVFDSPCDIDSVPYGLSRTIAGNTILAQVIEAFVRFTRHIFYPLSTKYHSLAAQTFIHQPLQCPSLFFASKSDKMANIDVIEKTIDVWSEKGVDVKLRAWDDTRHVSHYQAHPTEYSKEIDDFLVKIRLA